MKLILFEGLPGSGKSTFAQTIEHQLAANGVPAVWFYEEDRGHPLYPFHDLPSMQNLVTRLHAGRHAEVIDQALDGWRTFAAEIGRHEQVVVLDGCLFGYLSWTLFAAAAVAKIEGYVEKVEQIVAPLAPRLVYLRSGDVGRTLRRICDRRGGATEQRFIELASNSPYGRGRNLAGFPGMVRFWEAYRYVADALFARSRADKLLIDITAGAWDGYEQQVLGFLQLAHVEEPLGTPTELTHFAGRYRGTVDGALTVCEVRLESGRLYLSGPSHIWSDSRLIQRTTTTFAISSLPVIVAFEADTAGSVRALRLSGPPLFSGSTTGWFSRLDAQLA